MTMVKIKAIEPCDGHKPGDVFEVTERVAAQLVQRRLCKMAGSPQNKMAPQTANKANPSRAAGGAQRSSASRAAQASRSTIAKPSDAGALAIPRLGGSSR